MNNVSRGVSTGPVPSGWEADGLGTEEELALPLRGERGRQRERGGGVCPEASGN